MHFQGRGCKIFQGMLNHNKRDAYLSISPLKIRLCITTFNRREILIYLTHSYLLFKEELRKLQKHRDEGMDSLKYENIEIHFPFIKMPRVVLLCFSSLIGTTRSEALEKELKNLVVS